MYVSQHSCKKSSMKMTSAAVKASPSCLLNVTSMMGDTPSEPFQTEGRKKMKNNKEQLGSEEPPDV